MIRALARLARPPHDDAGTTLSEVVVSMALMMFAGSLIAGALIQIYRAVDSGEAVNQAQTQINAMFLRLDREIRYAYTISDPVNIDGDHYVEYLVDVGSGNTCVELRLRTTGDLQRRQWKLTGGTTAPTPWATLATNVSAQDSGTAPFTVTPPDEVAPAGSRFQNLTVAISANVGGGRASSTTTGATRTSTVTFTALNATFGNNSDTCTQARGDGT